MGLDNGFVLRNKKNNCTVELAYFRKFYQLDDYVRFNADGDSHNEEYIIDRKFLVELRDYLTPVCTALMAVYDKIDYYDIEGYPKEFDAKFYCNSFNPVDPEGRYSNFMGSKTLQLYFFLDNYIKSSWINAEDEWELTFYRSY